jgi:hypothetical protein
MVMLMAVNTLNIIEEFVRESNFIERIYRDPLGKEIDELIRFINLDKVTVTELEKFVSIYQPDARLRDKYGLDVRIRSYYPPFGGPEIRQQLEDLLNKNYNAYILHIEYEKLHPFTDGNGRSGRALWANKMKDISGGFLLNFYFDTLQHYSL